MTRAASDEEASLQTEASRPGYLTPLALAVLPVTLSVAVVALHDNWLLAAPPGIIVGLALGALWLRSMPSTHARFNLAVVVACTLAVFAPSCGARLGPHIAVLTTGVPTITLSEAARDERQWVRVTGGKVRTDLLGHSTFDHVDHGVRQKFAAPLVAADWAGSSVAVWLACQRSGPDAMGARAECVHELEQARGVLRYVPGEFIDAMDDARAQHGVVRTGDAHVYRSGIEAHGDIIDDAGPLGAIVLLCGLIALMITVQRRRVYAEAESPRR